MVTVPSSRSVTLRTIAVAVAATVLTKFAPFLLGALSVLMTDDLRLGAAGLGVAAAVFFASTGLASVPGGRLAERFGPRATILGAATVSMVALAGIALVARSFAVLLMFLVLAGMANGVAEPSANLALATGVRSGRHGMAFGIKQSAATVSSLLAGLAVPVIGVALGWRWAFGIAAAVAPLIAILMPPLVRQPSNGERIAAPVRALLPLAVATACAVAAATSLAAFLVPSAVGRGMSPGAAGMLLAAGSVTAIAVRLFSGWLADRQVADLAMVVTLLALGAVGFVLIAVAPSPLLLVVGTVVAFGAGWGWPAVFVLAIVRRHPASPASATGVVLAGAALGATLGPLTFGATVSVLGEPQAWLGAAGMAALAAFLTAR